jgi:RNA polymerase sigma factor (TIGR02999 family)
MLSSPTIGLSWSSPEDEAMALSPDTTALLHETTDGSPDAAEQLLAVVYQDLRERARQYLRRERSDHTLQATELVHEAYLRLVDQTRCEWRNRAHFMAVASIAMRRVLVDHARRRNRVKREGDLKKLSLQEVLEVGNDETGSTMLALDLAMSKLSKVHPEAARVVEMRFFGGLTHEESACALGVSPRTVSRQWEFAQAWLYREMGDGFAA